MDRGMELDLLEELLGLKEDKLAYLDDAVTSNAVTDYIDPDVFAAEQAAIFRAVPHMAAHSSELPMAGSFMRKEIAGLPLLLTRDADGKVHAFLNVCRHRGTRLVDEHEGCRKRFSCPYHAWTWNNRGDLVGVPHEKQGFPDLDRASMGLAELPCTEWQGWVWVVPRQDGQIDPQTFLSGLDQDFAWFGSHELKVIHSHEQEWAVNWKLLVEGGIEAYHFRVAHRETIGPFFNDNLSSYQTFGPHMRSVLPRSTFVTLREKPREEWQIREHANILYSLFPTSSLLVQQDHVAWIDMVPLAVDRTRIKVATLASVEEASSLTKQEAKHWQHNHDITCRTLNEDFEIGASIQSGLLSGANNELTFGRFEGALHRFNETVKSYLRSGAS